MCTEGNFWYPNSTLITGHDILFFWVARMLLMGQYVMREPPFPETFLHGLIFGKSYWRSSSDGRAHYITGEERVGYDLGKPMPQDVQFRWEKMSKSKGNVIDPIEMIEEYGTDAVRMALCSSVTQAREIDLERRRFEEFRNFANKLWNGARFVFMNLEGEGELTLLTVDEFCQGLDLEGLTLEDRWILSAISSTIEDVSRKLTTYTFDQASIEAYDFFWKEFCAYYLELAKPTLFGKVGTKEARKNKQKLLVILLCQSLRLLHPMAPFITEELFQRLKERFPRLRENPAADPYTREAIQALNAKACMVAPFPTVVDPFAIDPDIEEAFRYIEETVYTIRNIRGEMKLAPTVATPVHIIGSEDQRSFQLIASHKHLIAALVKTTGVEMHSDEPALEFASIGLVEGLKVMIPLPQESLKQEQVRLTKERERVSQAVAKTAAQLANPSFIERAPPPLVDKLKMQLESSQGELAEIESKLKRLEK